MFRKFLLPVILLPLLFYSCSQDPVDQGDNPDGLRLNECLSQTYLHTFEIVTWNVREFPIEKEKTIQLMADIIKREDPDLIAFQEITSEADFQTLIKSLPGWDGVTLTNSELNPAFIFKLSEINWIGKAIPLFPDEKDAFPRTPLMISVEHHSGLQLFLINIHLKCCSGTENERRRKAASTMLKSYIDDKLSNEKVMILGDFNDELISSQGKANVFSNFMMDSLNYVFTDMKIAMGNPQYWSYPGWPSHLDHILITNELFESQVFTKTLTYDLCDTSYLLKISDHRPLMIQLK
jgi:endonuclease/exonuclease/phosphatase family metal-dependent hydrolase